MIYNEIPEISVVLRFRDAITSTLVGPQHPMVVVCPERQDIPTHMITYFLVGAYEILSENRTTEEILMMLGNAVSKDTILGRETDIRSIEDGLGALGQATSLQWLGPDHIEPKFDIEMHAHYSSPANGNIHTIVPGKLVLLPTPADLPNDRSWIDVCEPDRPTERRFSAAYLADLLDDFDVSAVVCLGECSGESAAAFSERGLDVHDLRLDPSCPALLGAMDRLLALKRAAPGAVAVFPGLAGGGAGLMGTLAAACLTRDYGFGAGAAGAWLRMVCPALPG